jgi:hypothetical protein
MQEMAFRSLWNCRNVDTPTTRNACAIGWQVGAHSNYHLINKMATGDVVNPASRRSVQVHSIRITNSSVSHVKTVISLFVSMA